ncbi:sodium-dependent bicarbonate transport family permease [Halorhodospira abdelmalekii]|uniref:sodium-dependent bicarbonate transport family permease n=1 Tax=Halorhodospira abdelmalekii TaxID=421629 RepID=UPI0019055C4B|nr:sodium-dependent bicarbonate transport family permease [Halorhodospira abdelmalekii]MBK1735168.1 sodium-dependent bicarbonate transport family permease [Halorhodospira abdelmalekii]
MNIDPVLLFFLLGLTAGVLRSELRLPAAVYELVSILLLLAIGLKGGIELAQQPFLQLLPQIVAVIAMGALLTLIAFPLLLYWGRFSRADAASIAAHYGSVSVATYAVAAAYFLTRDIPFESHMPLLLAVLEIPAILVGIVLARGRLRSMRLGAVAHEVFLGKSIVLLGGGLLIGWAVGPEGVSAIEPLFFDLFHGILALFLLEMGLITAAQFGSLRRHGLFLILFGVAMPMVAAPIGLAVGWLLGLSVGGCAMMAVLAASASYIAVPAAMRISVPKANPTLSLAAALGVTFPFNVLIGIPLYYELAVWAEALWGA